MSVLKAFWGRHVVCFMWKVLLFSWRESQRNTSLINTHLWTSAAKIHSYLKHKSTKPTSTKIFEKAQEEACWFQLAVCCFTLWAMELVIPSMERVWGALHCSSYCAISLYDSFVPSKLWLPHSSGTILALWGAAEVHLLELSWIPVGQGRKWSDFRSDVMLSLRAISSYNDSGKDVDWGKGNSNTFSMQS